MFAASLLVCGVAWMQQPAMAQTGYVVGGGGRASVEVNLGVLDRVGQPNRQPGGLLPPPGSVPR